MSPSAEPAPLRARDALGSHWSFGQPARLLSLAPASALVVLQEASVPLSSPALILGSVLAQTGLVTAIGAPLAGWLRRTGRTLPVWAAVLVWAGIGAGRGAVGGGVYLLEGGAPDFAFRMLYWAQVAVLWMPLLAYVLAQLAHRRVLLAALASAEWDHQVARTRAARTQREVRDRVVSALHATVPPAIRDIRSRLAAVSGDPSRLAEIGSRLALASQDVSRIVETLSEAPAEGALPPARRPAPVAAALAFERRRPLVWASAAGAGILLAVGPLVARTGDVMLLISVTAAVVTSAAALVAASEISGRSAGMRRRVRIRDFVLQVFAASTGSLVLAALEEDGPGLFPILLLGALPLTLLYGVALISFTVGCGSANAELSELLGRVEDERRALEARTGDEEAHIREQLTALTHGPIQGRLAACAMALSFHASEGSDAAPGRTEYIAAAVLEHLDAVTADLAALRRAARVPSTRRIPPRAVVPAGAHP